VHSVDMQMIRQTRQPITSRSRSTHRSLRSRARVCRYLLNGADDVAKYEKWMHVADGINGPRYVTIGRPGHTQAVRSGLADWMQSLGIDAAGAAAIHRAFVIVPELPGYSCASSTAAREAALRGDRDTLLGVVCPEVADALMERARLGRDGSARE
jgi:hypothetical protein